MAVRLRRGLLGGVLAAAALSRGGQSFAGGSFAIGGGGSPTFGARLLSAAAVRTRPSLFGSPARLAATQALVGTGDADLDGLRAALVTKCNRSVAHTGYEGAVATYIVGDPTNLAAARQARRTIECNIIAWQLTGNTAYRDRTHEELMALIAWPDWMGNAHKITTAEATIAAAYGLEWLGGTGNLTPTEEANVVAAIANFGMAALSDAFFAAGDNSQYDTQPGLGSAYYPVNRTCVVASGAMAGAMALCVYPAYASTYATTVDAAQTNLNLFVLSTYVEGPSRESPGYAGYGHPHLALAACLVGDATAGQMTLELANYGLCFARATRWMFSTCGLSTRYTTHSNCGEYAATHNLCYAGMAHYEPMAQVDSTYQLVRVLAQADFDSTRSHMALMYWSWMRPSSTAAALDLVVKWDTIAEFIVRSGRAVTDMVTWLHGGGDPRPKWRRDIGTFGWDWAGIRWVYVESNFSADTVAGVLAEGTARANTMQFGTLPALTGLTAPQNGTTLTCPAGPFQKAHVGESITITGGTNFVAGTYRIAAYVSSTQVTLSAAPATVGNGSAGVGTGTWLGEEPFESQSNVAVAAGTWSAAHSDLSNGVGCYDFAAAKPVYPGLVTEWRRQLAKLSNNAIQVTDTWIPTVSGTAWRWAFHTYATVSQSGRTLTMTRTYNGVAKTATAYIMTPGYTWASSPLKGGIDPTVAEGGPAATGAAISRWEIVGTGTAGVEQQLVVRFYGADGTDSTDYTSATISPQAPA